MKLITQAIAAILISNFEVNKKHRETTGKTENFKPALKLFCPWGAATWLFTEWDGEDELFGLCDLGMGSPEMGYASLAEIQSIKHFSGLKIERDILFTPKKTLSEYADEAREKGWVCA